MYKFIKVSNNHDRLRDDVIECLSCSPIIVGEQVILIAPSRVKAGALRYVCTSPVVSTQNISDVLTEVTTESGSIYQIEKNT